MTIFVASFLIASAIVFSDVAFAREQKTTPVQSDQKSCSESLSGIDKEKLENAGFISEPVEQLLVWLERSNVDYAKQTTEIVPVDFVKVDLNTVFIQKANSLSSEISRDFFVDNYVMWPKHPFNTKLSLPHALERPLESRQARMTASRSIAFPKSRKIRYTVKMPTDHLHPGVWQPGKASTADDIISSVRRTKLIEYVDSHISPIPELILLKDVLSVADRKTGEGFIIRDLSALDDGNFYLPAFSIPYVGASIAALHGEDANTFWDKHYAKALGAVHAKLLLRYCINLETPNPQNMLIQLNRSMYPTGKIALLDLGDSSLIKPVCEGLGLAEYFREELKKDSDYRSNLQTQKVPFIHDTLAFGGFKDTKVFSPEDVWNMQKTFGTAYGQELANNLKLDSETAKVITNPNTWASDRFRAIKSYFESNQAAPAVREFQTRVLKSEGNVRRD